MISRLTVQEIFNIENSTRVTQDLLILSIFSTDHHIYYTDEQDPKVLKKISLKDFRTVQTYALPKIVIQKEIKSLAEIKGTIVLALNGCSDFFYINLRKQCLRIISHMNFINQTILYNKLIATCSDDLTVRIWDYQNGNIVQSKTKHIYSAHTGKINCLQTYHNILISGSNDKSAIFWKNNEAFCSYKSNFPVKNLLKCSQSHQICIFSQNGDISVIHMQNVIKYGKVQVSRIIKYSQKDFNVENCFRFCAQIDDSFIMFTDRNKIAFVEINLGQVINKKEISESHQNILGLKNIGRMLLYGQYQDNIYLLRY